MRSKDNYELRLKRCLKKKLAKKQRHTCKFRATFMSIPNISEKPKTDDGLTESERFVTSLCNRSFLKLWTHPNPIGKKGKELCDCLITCGDHIIIISVKENNYKDTGDKVGWERWQKAAIEKSASQIWGAERWIEGIAEVERKDGRIITLPEKNRRIYHRVSVSLGGTGKVPIKWGNFGNGFVHVCDEFSVGILFSALDTITDFVGFLSESERLVDAGVQLIFSGGGIEDLLACYMQNSFSFENIEDPSSTLIFLESDIWEGFSKSDEFDDYKESVKISYIWDRLIEIYADDLLTDGMFDMHSEEVTYNDLALVEMALQPRLYRASIAEAFTDFINNKSEEVKSRAVLGYGRTAFVFLLGPTSDRQARARELALRCLVVRGRVEDIDTVVGIGRDRLHSSTVGYSSDLAYIHMSEWSKEYDDKVTEIQKELGYFSSL